MPTDGPPLPGAAYEWQYCGARTMQYESCPSCGSNNLKQLDPADDRE